jgi:hypothetical protein
MVILSPSPFFIGFFELILQSKKDYIAREAYFLQTQLGSNDINIYQYLLGNLLLDALFEDPIDLPIYKNIEAHWED